jgi:hypothetical protein
MIRSAEAEYADLGALIANELATLVTGQPAPVVHQEAA